MNLIEADIARNERRPIGRETGPSSKGTDLPLQAREADHPFDSVIANPYLEIRGILACSVEAYVFGGNPVLVNPTPDAWFNVKAFAQPTAFTFGNSPRTMPYLRADGTNNFDFSVHKLWALWNDQSRLQFRAEFFNLFNRAAFYNPWSFFGDPNFGRVLQALPARSIQLGLKLNW